MGSLVVLMILAVFVMYVILGILYESFVHPITVLSSLPVALVGGLLTLWLFKSEASLYAYIGMFMLMGIVKKNGIMMIDFALQRMAEGQPSIEAIHDASVDRFRPIIMTTLAALMGAIPIALGFGSDGASRRPLGLIIVGGLVVSQLITLYVTPALYLYMESFQENVLDRIPFFRSHHVGHAVPRRTSLAPPPTGNSFTSPPRPPLLWKRKNDLTSLLPLLCAAVCRASVRLRRRSELPPQPTVDAPQDWRWKKAALTDFRTERRMVGSFQRR